MASGSAGLIMNIGARIGTHALTFDGDEAAIYSQNTAAGVIDAPVTITHGGLTKFGLGTVRLNAAATYTGADRHRHGHAVAGHDRYASDDDRTALRRIQQHRHRQHQHRQHAA